MGLLLVHRCSASCIDAKYFLQRVSGITKFKLMCKKVDIARLWINNSDKVNCSSWYEFCFHTYVCVKWLPNPPLYMGFHLISHKWIAKWDRIALRDIWHMHKMWGWAADNKSVRWSRVLYHVLRLLASLLAHFKCCRVTFISRFLEYWLLVHMVWLAVVPIL